MGCAKSAVDCAKPAVDIARPQGRMCRLLLEGLHSVADALSSGSAPKR